MPKADDLIPVVSASSIISKTIRDASKIKILEKPGMLNQNNN